MKRAALVALLMSSGALAQGAQEEASVEQIQKRRVEELRAELTSHLHLMAYELVDELVFGFKEEAPFASVTDVVLADVTAPLGFGSGLEALIETHLAQALLRNKDAKLRLVHCPACTAMTVRSEARGTVIARGVDAPEVLESLEARAGHALFLDFEAEGTELVLRARITRLDPELPIVFARTLSTRTTSAALLRAGDPLVSAEDARDEYIARLEGRGPIGIPLRIHVSQFAANEDATTLTTAPMIWLKVGGEVALSSARRWLGALHVGGTFIPQAYSGFIVEARASRIISGTSSSMVHPDLYWFIGASLATVSGPTALVLRDDVPTPADLVGATTGVPPFTVYPTFQTGLELRVNRRIGATFFMETAPTVDASPQVGRYLDFGIVSFQSFGGEVVFWF